MYTSLVLKFGKKIAVKYFTIQSNLYEQVLSNSILSNAPTASKY